MSSVQAFLPAHPVSESQWVQTDLRLQKVLLKLPWKQLLFHLCLLCSCIIPACILPAFLRVCFIFGHSIPRCRVKFHSKLQNIPKKYFSYNSCQTKKIPEKHSVSPEPAVFSLCILLPNCLRICIEFMHTMLEQLFKVLIKPLNVILGCC